MRLVCVYGVDEENRDEWDRWDKWKNPIKRSVTHLSYQAKRPYLSY